VATTGDSLQELGHLRAFAEVVKSGSFSEAARRLNLSTAAVSRSISKIESELGLRLLMRNTRNIHLTDVGRSYYEAVRTAIDNFTEASDAIVSDTKQIAGTIRAAMPGTWTRTHVLPALGAFLDEHPRIDIELSFYDLLPDLVTGGFDVGVQYSEPVDSVYIARCIHKVLVYLVASPTYLAKHGIPKTPADLVNHDCINVQLSSGTVTWRLFGDSAGNSEEHVHVPRGRLFMLNHYESMLEAAVNGLGIAVADVSSALPLLESGKLRVVLPNYHVTGTERGATKVMMIYPHRHYVPLRVRLFMDFLAGLANSEADLAFRPHDFAG
jgi:DNA-binding transcriptional LysR family regulator